MPVAPEGRVAAVINADDFGISRQVSHDVVRCFEAGRISSTTIMANMPGFEEACALARRHGFSERVGVHLNLTCGPSLSKAMQQFCRGGGSMAIPERRLTARRDVLAAVEAEIRAQILRVRREGIEPTHIDSHEHILNGFPYARVALRIARELGVRRIRLARNACYHKTPLKWLFKGTYNRYLRLAGMRTVRYFTDVKPYFRHVQGGGAHLPGPVELMCHPGARLSAPASTYEGETQFLLSQEFGEFLGSLRLIPYHEV